MTTLEELHMQAQDPSTLIAALSVHVSERRSQAHRILHHLIGLGRAFLLQSDLRDAVVYLRRQDASIADSALIQALLQCQEAAIDAAWVYLALRLRIARRYYLRIHLETMHLNQVSVSEYLAFKEHLATGDQEDPFTLEIDMAPFDRSREKLLKETSIGRGVEFLNRNLANRLFEAISHGDQRLLHFLQRQSSNGRRLLLNDTINSIVELRSALRQALIPLRRRPPQTPADELIGDLRALGFEPGWGKDAGRIRNTMGLLLDMLEEPSPDSLEQFPEPSADDLLHRDPIPARLVWTIQGTWPTGYRRPGRLYPRSGARAGARDARAPSGTRHRSGTARDGGDAFDPASRGQHVQSAPRAHRRHPQCRHPAGAVSQ